jgi:putative FmdB family regulatory protein
VPTYDYQCRSCGVITEVVHSMLEDGPIECDRCGGPLRRVVHPTGIIFRGSGFYKNDSRSSTSGSVAGGNRGPAQPSGEGSPAATTPADNVSSNQGNAPAPPSADSGKSSTGGD